MTVVLDARVRIEAAGGDDARPVTMAAEDRAEPLANPARTTRGDTMTAKDDRYRVHRVGISMTKDEAELERFLNDLRGEVVSIVPNVTVGFLWVPRVDFLLVVEKLPAS
jgi:hypothetical protein